MTPVRTTGKNNRLTTVFVKGYNMKIVQPPMGDVLQACPKFKPCTCYGNLFLILPPR